MKRVILTILVIAFLRQANACTTFFLHRGNEMVFGRNYDWITGNGLVCTNLKGLVKQSADPEGGPALSWTSKFGSITFNQYGKEFPTGGMNEKGLVVELMWLDDTRYPSADQRPAIGVLQWIQYQLDCHTSVQEVIASDKQLRIRQNDVPLHYLVADASGKSATIEFLDGKMVVHTGESLKIPALTNETYQHSMQARTSGANGNNSHERFTQTCTMLESYRANAAKPAVDYAFDILKNVSQGNFTRWSIVYDITRKQIHFRTSGADTRKSVSFADFDFACSAQTLVLDINEMKGGNARANFTAYSLQANKKLVETSMNESKSRVTATPDEVRKQVEFPTSVICR